MQSICSRKVIKWVSDVDILVTQGQLVLFMFVEIYSPSILD